MLGSTGYSTSGGESTPDGAEEESTSLYSTDRERSPRRTLPTGQEDPLTLSALHGHEESIFSGLFSAGDDETAGH
eukprot:SAG22_NODE_12570_length_437_cov_1.526627_2_plen_74_part_01